MPGIIEIVAAVIGLFLLISIVVFIFSITHMKLHCQSFLNDQTGRSRPEASLV